MDKANPLLPFHRPITLGLLIITIGSILLIQLYPVSETRRLLLVGLVVFVGAVGLLTVRFLYPRPHPSVKIIYYGGITLHSIAIAVAQVLLGSLDAGLLYFLRIIASGMIWDYKAALYSAFLASIFQPFVALLLGMSFASEMSTFVFTGGVYFLSAFLISEFAQAYGARWRLMNSVAEQQHREIAQRKDELELLFEISQSLGNLKDIETALQQLTARVAQVLHVRVCAIARADATSKQVRGMPPGFGLTDEQIASYVYPLDAVAISVWDMNQSQYFVANDLTQLPNPFRQYAERFQLHQIAAGRMMIQGIPTGYVLVGNKTDGSAFSESDGRLLSILAEQTATVVENARLYTDLSTNLQNAARLYAISTELISHLKLEEIPQRVVMTVAEALRAPIATIALMNEETQKLEYAAAIGIPDRQLQVPFRNDGLGMTALKTGIPRFIEDVENEEKALPASKVIGYRAVACLPIHHGEKRYGALYVNFTQPHQFTPAEKNLLAIFANQTAIALENAQLYEREQKRSAELDAIAEIGRRATSILDLDELLPTVVHLVHTKFGYRYAHLFLNNLKRRQTLLRAGVGPTIQPVVPGSFALNFGEGIVGWVAEHGETLLANDVRKDVHFLFGPAVPDTRSELAVPLKASGQVVGVLDVQSDKLNAFEPNDVTIFETLASQVAVAIENARLYGHVQEQARRDSLTQVFNHGYFIERLYALAEKAQREDPLTLIMLDIDYYKEYNDRFGHVVGDQMLKQIVQVIQSNVKAIDLVGRWGGEEFGILLPDTDAERGQVVADRIRKTLAAVQLKTREGILISPPTVSQGIAEIPRHARDAATLIDVADAALYRAKSRGRDQIQVAGTEEQRGQQVT